MRRQLSAFNFVAFLLPATIAARFRRADAVGRGTRSGNWCVANDLIPSTPEFQQPFSRQAFAPTFRQCVGRVW
jgi:hypothetical protein